MSESIDFGFPSVECVYCHAQLWFEERVGKCSKTNEPLFSICCMKGKVELPFLNRPPPLLTALMDRTYRRSDHFKDNIRAYNSMFAFTSMGGKVETSNNKGGAPPQFIVSGQNFHRIGSLIPEQGSHLKFAQLYIYDTGNEIRHRCNHFKFYFQSTNLIHNYFTYFFY